MKLLYACGDLYVGSPKGSRTLVLQNHDEQHHVSSVQTFPFPTP